MAKTLKSGIYKLEWTNGYFYIGQSANLKNRWSTHRSSFKSGKMQKHQPKLYNVWLKHGEPTFHILELHLSCQLNDAEQRHITAHWGHPLFCNTSPSSRNTRGVKRTKPSWNKGISTMTAEHKQILMDARGDQSGENHPMVKLTDTQVMEIRQKYIPFKYSTTRLAKEYGVTSAHIKSIVNNKTWIHLPSADIEKNKTLIAEEGLVEFNGESRNLRQWAKHLGLDYLTLYQRIKKYNWSLDRAFSETSHKQGQKLTEIQVREIRVKYGHQVKGNGSTALAKQYGVSHKTILRIVNRQTYANVI